MMSNIRISDDFRSEMRSRIVETFGISAIMNKLDTYNVVQGNENHLSFRVEVEIDGEIILGWGRNGNEIIESLLVCSKSIKNQ